MATDRIPYHPLHTHVKQLVMSRPTKNNTIPMSSIVRIAKEMQVSPRTVHRWLVDDEIPFHSADQVCVHALGIHPAEIWGMAWYTYHTESYPLVPV